MAFPHRKPGCSSSWRIPCFAQASCSTSSTGKTRAGAFHLTAQHRILVVRLGSMGDILHALPAVALMRRTWPETCIEWAVHPKWADLFVGNPLDVHPIYVDRKDPVS